MAQGVTVVHDVPQSSRHIRRPQHQFEINCRPFQINAFALAPVLPGETLKQALVQIRAVSDPVKNPLCGWWFETYLFYVKHRDMPNSADFQSMVLQYGYDMTSAIAVAAVRKNYHNGNAIDWVDQCIRAIVPFYFREEGEAWNIALSSGVPMARINQSTWLDSALPDSQVVAGGTVPTGGTAQATELLLQQYELLRDMKLLTITYEEFLRSYGVRAELAAKPNKPELIRYSRDWTYPSNTIDPLTGSPSSAVSWAIAERADKDRYFSEPGFIFGCSVVRPKVYLANQVSNASGMLSDAMTWLPAVLSDRPETSLKRFANTAGPLAGKVTEPFYWVDVRDLFLYGDQFINGGTAGVADPALSQILLPTVAMQKKYPDSADLDAFFDTVANQIRYDGVLSLTIATSQTDHTP